MQTHDDRDFRREWMERLQQRAASMVRNKQSEITAGKQDEQPLAEWKAHGVGVRHMPDDEQGILRISVGGGEDLPISLNYCVFRGSIGQCIDLMHKAIRALREAP